MYSQRLSLKGIVSYKDKLNLRFLNTQSSDKIKLGKILLLSKLSYYENERYKYAKLSEKEFQKLLEERGSDYDRIIQSHEEHRQYTKKIIKALKRENIEFKLVHRNAYSSDLIRWADAVMPIGGDGTFLLAASQVFDNEKPVIGMNSDPQRSEGHLCLPKSYSTKISEAIRRIKNGEYRWSFRSRIRVTVHGDSCEITTSHLYPDNYSVKRNNFAPYKKISDSKIVLPYLALNEVFVGEYVAARVSHLQMWLKEGDPITNMKCSGLCVSTGTGSTSWHMSINRLTSHTVAELLKLVKVETDAQKLTDDYNKSLSFPPDKMEMAYSVRELFAAGVWPNPKGLEPRGFTKQITIKSRCLDACMVVDGGVSYSFNDGCVAVLEMHPEDTLRTIVFND